MKTELSDSGKKRPRGHWLIDISVICIILTMLWFMFYFNPYPERQPSSSTDSLVKEREQQSEEQFKHNMKELEKVRKKFEDVAKEAGLDPEKDNIDPFGFLGIDEHKEDMENSHKAALKLKLIDLDIQGMDDYYTGDFKSAEKLFQKSLHKLPARPFPWFFLGCTRFELERYGDAEECFSKAYQLEPQSKSSLLISNMCSKLKSITSPEAGEIINAYDISYKQTMDYLKLSEPAFSLASTFSSPFSSDPIYVRAKQLTGVAFARQQTKILHEFVTTDDIEQKLILLLLMNKKTAGKLITELASKHPGHLDLQYLSFFNKHFSSENDQKNKAEFSDDLERMKTKDPENGFLILLGMDSNDEEKPFNENEIQVFHRAVMSKNFKPFISFRIHKVMMKRIEVFGPLVNTSTMGYFYNISNPFYPLRTTPKRAMNTVLKYLIEGKRYQADALLSDILSLLKLIRSSANGMLPILLSDSIDTSVTEKLLHRCHKLGLNKHFIKHITRYKKILQRGQMNRAGAMHLLGFIEIPMRKIMKTNFAFDTCRETFQERADRMLRLYKGVFEKKAIDHIDNIDSDDVLASHQYQSVVCLRLLKSKKALPLLEKLSKHPDPILAFLSIKAAKEIKQNPQEIPEKEENNP